MNRSTYSMIGGLLALVFTCGTATVHAVEAGSDAYAAQSASITVKGTVRDAAGQPIVGVSVLEHGSMTNGTTTLAEGTFTITVPAGTSLDFTCIGYEPMTVAAVEGMSVAMQETVGQIEDVVVTALGMKREKKALGYSVQDLKGDALLENRTDNIATSLSGKVAGMTVTGTSIPGGSNRIVIRGNNSISGNNMPLIVIDGIPYDNSQGSSGDTSWGSGFNDLGDGLSQLNANDIESMSILKGPSATALYGSRGGNGVILVTTKRAREGKTTVTYNMNFQASTIALQPELQNEYGQGTNGVFDMGSRNSWGPRMEGQMIKDWTGTEQPFSPSNNDFDSFMNTGTTWTNSVDIATASEKANLRVGLTNSMQNGMMPNNTLNKTNISVRAGVDITPKLHFDTKVSYAYQKGAGRPEFAASAFNPIFALIYTPRSIDLHQMKGVTRPDGSVIDWSPSMLTIMNNPYAIAELTGNSDITHRVNGFASLRYDFTDWLNAQVRYGLDTYNQNSDKWYRHGLVTTPAYKDGRYIYRTKLFTEINADFLITASKEHIGGSRFSGAINIGGNIMNRSYRSTSQTASGLYVPEVYTIENGKSVSSTNYRSTKQIQSLYGTVQLSWDNYIFLDVTARNDWSSTLPKDNWSFFYPSVSLGWVVSDMFRKMDVMLPKWITFLKLRGSYAEAGNDTDPYSLYPTMGMVTNMTGGLTGVYLPGTQPNPNLKPEIIKSYEFGLEARFLNNRLGVDVTYYSKRAYNQIIAMPVSITSGYTSRMINAGRLDNSGWEVMLTGAPVRNKNWNWDLTVNFAKNNSKVVELIDGVDEIDLFNPMGQNCYVKARPGEPYGQIYTNDFVYDAEGNRVVGDNGKYLLDPVLRAKGNMNPDWTMGIGSQLRWKNLSFGFLIDIRYGGDIYLQSMMRLQTNGQTQETVPGRAEYYANHTGLVSEGVNVNTGQPNTVELDPTSYWSQFYGNIGNYIYDATNVRLRELSLGYTFPERWFRNSFVTTMKLSFVANNVCFLYNALPGFDPECTFTTGNGQGVETAALPSARTFGFNFNIVF